MEFSFLFCFSFLLRHENGEVLGPKLSSVMKPHSVCVEMLIDIIREFGETTLLMKYLDIPESYSAKLNVFCTLFKHKCSYMFLFRNAHREAEGISYANFGRR
jgi:hypothetical protein